MPLTLTIDTRRWRRHLARTAADHPGLVPVIKGNGYGPGLERLAQEASLLGVDTVAVGTTAEALVVAARFRGRVLVLQPHHPALPEPRVGGETAARLIRTIASPEAADAVRADGTAVADVVVELLTSVGRHGVSASGLRRVVVRVPPQRLAGFAVHLPLSGRPAAARAEVEGWVERLRAAGALPAPLWVSHVEPEDLAALRHRHPDVAFRPRVGTRLWLADPGALTASATVCDVHPIRRGQRVGYRGRRVPWDGHLVTLAGGTANGVSMSAPRFVRGLRARLALGAEFGLAELNRTRAPFTIAGRRPLLVEPPHMQASLVLLPAGVPVPRIGSEVPVRLRFTTALFDRVVDVVDPPGVAAWADAPATAAADAGTAA